MKTFIYPTVHLLLTLTSPVLTAALPGGGSYYKDQPSTDTIITDLECLELNVSHTVCTYTRLVTGVQRRCSICSPARLPDVSLF